MTLEVLDMPLSVCQVASLSALPKGLFFLAQTDEECSLVCETAHMPSSVTVRSDGWRAFRVQGTLDFSLVGILAKLSRVLAKGGIGLFAVSTYRTDYILTKADRFEQALCLLQSSGYTIKR